MENRSKMVSGKIAKQLSLHTIEPSCFCQTMNRQGLSPGLTDVITIPYRLPSAPPCPAGMVLVLYSRDLLLGNPRVYFREKKRDYFRKLSDLHFGPLVFVRHLFSIQSCSRLFQNQLEQREWLLKLIRLYNWKNKPNYERKKTSYETDATLFFEFAPVRELSKSFLTRPRQHKLSRRTNLKPKFKMLKFEI